MIWKLPSKSLDVSRGVIMGVINVTPDSFSDGGLHLDSGAAIAVGRQMMEQGADLVDIGGESTRPGAEAVPAAEELRRVLPVVETLVADGAVVSIDTSKPEVAREALLAGAEIVNDVTAAATCGMPDVLGEWGAGVVLMHMKGTPRTMQRDPSYDDVVAEVGEFLGSRAQQLVETGVDPASIAIDPGIGFGKTVTHNLELIDGLEKLAGMGFPVVLGTSRKTFLGRVAGIEDPTRRDGVTAVTTALGFERGARVFRVHDVASSRAALSLAAAIVNPQQWDEWSQD
ncbi:MAG TPA: dihydropteroate synthase [Acidimicrobiia bacterium]|nr:dihydropteroate synthase [Acidimicrobiia bacterium]